MALSERRDGRPRRRVFLDVGAHVGETLAVVTQARWAFDVIYSFEPAPACWPELERRADARVVICRFGLSDRAERRMLYNAGEIGASISVDKQPVEGPPTECEFVDAGAWLERNVRQDDDVYLKINVEGAEPEVILSLDAAGQLARIAHLLIHFDVRKVPSRAHLERETRNLLDVSGVDYVDADRLFHGDVYRGTRNWLEWCSLTGRRRAMYEAARRAEGRARVALYPIKQAIRSRRSREPSAS